MGALAHEIKKKRAYTMADVETLHEEGIWAELINGQIYVRETPEIIGKKFPYDIFLRKAPGMRHQAISVELSGQISNYLRGKRFHVFHGATVKLTDDDAGYVIPDIFVVCNPSKITPRACLGVPDFIIEILSTHNKKDDTIIKFRQYLQVGVPEYWIVDPEANTVTMHRLVGNQYTTAVCDETETAPIACLPGFEIDFSLVFKKKFMGNH